MEDPEEYAIKNWIVRVQGFLINCATFGFTSNYNAIMKGEYRYDLFHRTFAEKLMDLLGDLAFRKVFTSDAIYRMEVAESAMIDFLMDKFIRAVIRYDVPGEKLGTIENRMVSFISSNYKNAYHYHAQGKERGGKAVSAASPGDGLYLRDDGQLRQASVSGDQSHRIGIFCGRTE